MNVRYLPAASDDVADAAVRIDARSGLGGDFNAEVRRAAAAIGANPQMYARTEDGPDEPENRDCYIARFGYRVIYAIWKGEAVIVAVIHTRRRPGSWLPRLTELD